MDILNPQAIKTLPDDFHNSFYGIAFDGCFFYLTAPQECNIYKFKPDFTMVGSIKTDKPYSCICYDSTENCFWVTADKHTDIIYKLDCTIKEAGSLKIKNCKKACSSIVGLSYDCEKDTLLAAYRNLIAEVPKDGDHIYIIMDACESSFAAVLSIAPYYAVIQKDEERQSFKILTRKGHCVKDFCIPDMYKIRDVLFYPCNKSCADELEFILLAEKKSCCQRVLLKFNIYELVLCRCNYGVCHAHCNEDKDEHCICDIIKSIALVETSLSHILNAEGEKLQKAVELAKNIDELLAVNKSVTNTIINAAQLEHHLYLSLDAINDICKKKNHKKENSK